MPIYIPCRFTPNQLGRVKNQITQHVARRIIEQYLFHAGFEDTTANTYAVDRAVRYFVSHPNEIAMILIILNKIGLFEQGIEDPCS